MGQTHARTAVQPAQSGCMSREPWARSPHEPGLQGGGRGHTPQDGKKTESLSCVSLQSSWPALLLKGLLPAAPSLDVLLGVLPSAGRPVAFLWLLLVCAGRPPLFGLDPPGPAVRLILFGLPPVGRPDFWLLVFTTGKTGQAPGGALEGILGPPLGKVAEAKPRPSTASCGAVRIAACVILRLDTCDGYSVWTEALTSAFSSCISSRLCICPDSPDFS